ARTKVGATTTAVAAIANSGAYAGSSAPASTLAPTAGHGDDPWKSLASDPVGTGGRTSSQIANIPAAPAIAARAACGWSASSSQPSTPSKPPAAPAIAPSAPAPTNARI